MKRELGALGEKVTDRASGPPLIHVPTSGVHYGFEKLYANQTGEKAWFAIPYATAGGTWLGQFAVLGGLAVFWTGVFSYRRSEEDRLRRRALGIAGIGFLVVALVLNRYALSAIPAMIASLLVLGALYREHVAPLVARLRRVVPGAPAS